MLDEPLAPIAGPITFTPTSTNRPVVTENWAVWQEKGEEEWDAPWSEDLQTLGFWFEDVTFVFPQNLTIPTGSSVYFTANIRVDFHSQQWHGSWSIPFPGSGTAIRGSYIDSLQGYEVDVA